AESTGDLGGEAADAAIADNADRGTGKLDSHALGRHGTAVIGDRRGSDVAGEVDDLAKDQLGHRIDEAGAGIGDQHAVARGGGNIDGAGVDRTAQQGGEVGKAVEQGGLGRRVDVADDDVGARRSGDQLVG